MIRTAFRMTLALGAFVLAASLVPTSLLAQQVQVQAQAQAGPRLARAGISASFATPSALVPQQDHSMGNGTNVAMMIVGGTALIVGLSVGGDGGQIIAVSGAVIGLIGMFRYLR